MTLLISATGQFSTLFIYGPRSCISSTSLCCISAFIVKLYQQIFTTHSYLFKLDIFICFTYMRTLLYSCLVLFTFTQLTGFVYSAPTPVNLTKINNDWQIQILQGAPEAKSLIGQKLKTQLPSTIHLDLLKHKKIQDPFYRNNYQKLLWISQSKIKYSKKFNIDESNFDKSIELIFHGIDTYGTVLLNGKQILKTNNSFVRYTERVQKLIKKQNLLEIIIQSTQKFDQLGQSKNSMPFKYAHTRKACYQYSWDWAPQMVTLGIWKDVQIRIFQQLRLDYVWVRNKQISQQNAVLNFATKLQFSKFKKQKISDGYKLKIVEKNLKIEVESTVTQQTNYVNYAIHNPKFWWPNGFGEPHVYQFTVQLSKDGKLIDKQELIYGIRTVELDLKNKQFKVIINGYPIYCKGANYVPLDMLHPRITNQYFQSQKTYKVQKLFQDAVNSNFNMIRLWGGGQYESNQFLQIASRRGIMIFYDFMFSDSVYPSNYQFLVNVQQQVKQQIRRTRNYPSLALWSGNNQILQGIQDWGWSSGNYVKDYKQLFQNLIRKIVQIQSPDISYIPSSPIYGVGNYGFERGGDFHYWSVWAGGAGFQSYQQAVGPFNSQFGTQALPVWHTIKQFTLEEDRNYSSPMLLAHQRHNSQFNTLRSYMDRYMNKSKDFQNQVYLSGVLQAFAIQIAFRSQRTSKPKSYGTLYWQFNDAWPAISWSAIDYFGRWKPLQYMAKRSYQNIAIFTFRNGSVIAVNDLFAPVEVTVKIHVIKFNGEVVHSHQEALTLQADSTKQVYFIQPKFTNSDPRQVVAYTEILHKNEIKMWNTFYYVNFKDLKLQKATVSAKYNENTNQITLQADKLVKNLFIDHKQKYVQFSDNYFDVVPGHPRTIRVLNSLKLSQIKAALKYQSVRQASVNQNLEVKFK